jgi:cytosine deaminase
MLDLVVRRALLAPSGDRPRPDVPARQVTDIGVRDGRIVAIAPCLPAGAAELDAAGRLVVPGLVDTHLHLDKSRVADRCAQHEGTLAEALRETSRVKAAFTEQDIYDRGRQTLEGCILHGTTHVRTHVEVDPAVGLRGVHAIQRIAADLAWAVDVQMCVFAQEGLTDAAETDDLLVAALEAGAPVIGGAPYADVDPSGQLDRIFELARRFDVDVDLHLDFGDTPEGMQLDDVCKRTTAQGWEGRVTVGHVTQLSLVAPERYAELCALAVSSGVALTVLPATDLFLMGRVADRAKPRGVTSLAGILERGGRCSLASNNILNAFTPFGDGSLVRMANLYANVAHVGTRAGLRQCLEMVTTTAAKILGAAEYGIRLGAQADLVCLDAGDSADAVARLAPATWAVKRGHPTFARALPSLTPPKEST